MRAFSFISAVVVPGAMAAFEATWYVLHPAGILLASCAACALLAIFGAFFLRAVRR